MARNGKGLTTKTNNPLANYRDLLADVVRVIEDARRAAARSVNAVMTATYWFVGRRIVEEEQGGKARAGYGQALLDRLSADLTTQFGRGFSRQNLQQMRQFYLAYPAEKIRQTLSGESRAAPIRQTASGRSSFLRDGNDELARAFPLPWSHYVRLMSVDDPLARAFYESEALCGGWTVRQLDRQVGSQYYERTAFSRNKAAMLRKGSVARLEDAVSPEEEFKSPYVLEFLGLKDEYSESDLETALIARLQTFLLELGDDFAFVGRQRRFRLDDAWYRVDLLFFHRRLRCLVVVDLKLGEFTHADAGQMHLYLNYARAHWVRPGENPPVGLILCAKQRHAVAHYALEGLANKILAAEYRTTLPDAQVLAAELERTRLVIEERKRRPHTMTARRRPGPTN
jgi:predicted nuclease of restriction endonuclease-like (RecB) superfamily